mmetsp:Transcript_23371/g.53917  ORF Transcript_23371/g.53917 Transcript_23371/m.53917 type:complete len:674 (-) Transcript_23371:305-2326(-)
MGFLRESEPIAWDESKKHLQAVRRDGIEQFCARMERCRRVQGDSLKWGEEVEHQIFKLVGGTADKDRSVRLPLRSPQILQKLQKAEAERQSSGTLQPSETTNWVPEYGRWMVESTPGHPYQGLDGTQLLEGQLRLRRNQLKAALGEGEIAPTMTAFPMLGEGEYTEPALTTKGPVMESLFVGDEAVFTHPRFPTLAKNVRARRGGKVAIRRPLFKDVNTAEPTHPGKDFVPATVQEASGMDHVYGDSMAFGMGSSCLQVTLQAADVEHSRAMYDQLLPLAPILLALTAATPFMRGRICEDDVRWAQIAQSVDDRTPAERGLTDSSEHDSRLAGAGTRRLQKSRYDSVDCYIGKAADTEDFNDQPVAFDDEHFQRLLQQPGMDETLARHVAHLFARDPLVIFRDRIDLNNSEDIDHWENLQSTNWQSLRWKPPPPHQGEQDSTASGHIGWRVEFRTMELQLTDFENAAFTAFVVLLTQVIEKLNLDLRIPISKVDANMQEAAGRDACTSGRFWFRTQGSKPAWEQMTMAEIMCGRGAFAGLIPLCKKFLDETEDVQPSTKSTLNKYLNFIRQKSTGKLKTTATWMREFVTSHPAYVQDSCVPVSAAYDLLLLATEIGEGRVSCPDLLGEFDAKAHEPLCALAGASCLDEPCTCARACMNISHVHALEQLVLLQA